MGDSESEKKLDSRHTKKYATKIVSCRFFFQAKFFEYVKQKVSTEHLLPVGKDLRGMYQQLILYTN